MYRPTPVELPPGVVTATFLAPTLAPAGATAVIVVELTTTKLVTATPLIVAPVAPMKLVPVMVIEVPALSGPLVGATAVTVVHCA